MTDTIARVLIKCPTTGTNVHTVYRLRPTAFEALRGEYSFRCERCGDVHTWRKEDAWLENTPGRVPQPAAPVDGA